MCYIFWYFVCSIHKLMAVEYDSVTGRVSTMTARITSSGQDFIFFRIGFLIQSHVARK
jgi:hypothetical protein